MPTIDLKKDLRHLYNPPARAITLVDVPPMHFLMIEGHGDPNTAPAYAEAVAALYGLAYALKFAVKKHLGIDHTVMPLEGLWWAEDMTAFTARSKSEWDWTMMIRQPDQVTADFVAAAAREVAEKKALPALPAIRFEPFHEGRAAQTLHIGPYDAEGPTIAALHAFIREQGLTFRGKHHEIYLSDPRRTAPEKMRTVLRQPVE